MLGLKDAAVNASGARHVSIESMRVVDARGVGVLAADVTDVHVRSVTSALHARQGIYVTNATDSSATRRSRTLPPRAQSARAQL